MEVGHGPNGGRSAKERKTFAVLCRTQSATCFIWSESEGGTRCQCVTQALFFAVLLTNRSF
jgi:hypothetical protein